MNLNVKAGAKKTCKKEEPCPGRKGTATRITIKKQRGGKVMSQTRTIGYDYI